MVDEIKRKNEIKALERQIDAQLRTLAGLKDDPNSTKKQLQLNRAIKNNKDKLKELKNAK